MIYQRLFKITGIYALSMALIGLIGFLSNPSKAISSLIVGLVAAACFGLVAAFLKKEKRGALTALTLMAGLFSVMLVWRSLSAWQAYFQGNPEKFFVAFLCSVMLLLSLVMSGLGFIFRTEARS